MHATLLNINMFQCANIFLRHPDKTDHPMAEDKFVEITKAYEVCSVLFQILLEAGSNIEGVLLIVSY